MNTNTSRPTIASLFPRGVLGPTSPGRSGPTWPTPTSFGPTLLGSEHLATCLAESLSSLPMTDRGGAESSSQTILPGPGELGTVGPEPLREISVASLEYAVRVDVGEGPLPAALGALMGVGARCGGRERVVRPVQHRDPFGPG